MYPALMALVSNYSYVLHGKNMWTYIIHCSQDWINMVWNMKPMIVLSALGATLNASKNDPIKVSGWGFVMWNLLVAHFQVNVYVGLG